MKLMGAKRLEHLRARWDGRGRAAECAASCQHVSFSLLAEGPHPATCGRPRLTPQLAQARAWNRRGPKAGTTG
eukprot:8316978-Alexandrium_andersonii.AAC.1